MTLDRDRLGPYEIIAPIGSGGMGEVYRARHTRLQREVAIKVLAAGSADSHSLARFEREARTASALNHPNIVTIYDIAEDDGITYIAMELVAGRPLGALIANRQMPVTEVMRIGIQIANGLARAHAAGIVHRDLKPGNVMVTNDGLVKILDFGLAKPLFTSNAAAGPLTADTRDGIVVGTPHYMSPEQASGELLDHRSDQFAFGVILFEMLAGKPPFDGPSAQSVLTALITRPAPPLKQFRPDTPPALEAVIERCLQKSAADRFPTSEQLLDALRRLQPAPARGVRHVLGALRRPQVAMPVAGVVFAAAASVWIWISGAERRWSETRALGEIAGHVEQGNLYLAYRTASVAEKYRGDDPALRKLVERITLPLLVNSEPSGAQVWVRSYSDPEEPWRLIGTTPLETRAPYALMRWRITLPGHEPFEGAPFGGGSLGALRRGMKLDSIGSRPPEMVRVPAGPPGPPPPTIQMPGPIVLDSYLLDRFEVTNRQYREFVAAGGYASPDLWPAMERDARAVPFAEAMSAFRDASGRPGPSTWEVGAYAPGDDDLPVSGVSWFEAAAYCKWAGKSLPTLYHWTAAIGQDQLSDILRHSNMDAPAKVRIGSRAGLAAYGTYDMAGNVKEWVWNSTGTKRFILGGSWNEPTYIFRHAVADDPWSRAATHGLRCAKFEQPLPPVLLAPIALVPRITVPPPVSEETFALLRGTYAYERTPLDAEVEEVNDSLPGYRMETVSFRAAYGGERMRARLLIPRDVPPPWQAVIWFPGDDVFMLGTSTNFSSAYLFDFIPRAGRVLVYPVYDGMHERFRTRSRSPEAMRDAMRHWSQDIGRTIDYLETRSDFDATKIAYYGFSSGAYNGPVFSAIDPRLRVSILLAGGLVPLPFRPENHPAHFAPRSRSATLMINGVDDFLMWYDEAQRPFFELLGAPPSHRKHARLPGGHIPTNRLDIAREVLDWLDRHFGPVAQPAQTRQAGAPGR
jgi:eukaryotic-like serine/threonine-protein kinase